MRSGHSIWDRAVFGRDGSGTYSLPEADFVNGTTIDAPTMNSDLGDIEAALTASLAKDGQTTPTANLPMGNFKHTGVGEGTARNHYAAVSQTQDGGTTYAAATDGGTDAYTASLSPAVTAYVTGMCVRLKFNEANTTTTPTIALNGIASPKTIVTKAGGALAIGAIAANGIYDLTYDGTNFMLGSPTNFGTQSALVAMSGAAINEAQGSNIASATTTDIGAATGNYVVVTGTTTITGFGTVQAGTRRIVEFSGALTLTHNATSLILPKAQNITTAAGDVGVFVSEGSGNWRCVSYTRAAGVAFADIDADFIASASAVTAAAGDYMLIMDSSDSNNSKRDLAPYASTWNPTFSSPFNLDSTPTASGWFFARLGAMVFFGGHVSCDPTATGLAQVKVDKPVASNFGAASDAQGSFNSGGTEGEAGAVYASAADDLLVLEFKAASTTAHTMIAFGWYTVI